MPVVRINGSDGMLRVGVIPVLGAALLGFAALARSGSAQTPPALETVGDMPVPGGLQAALKVLPDRAAGWEPHLVLKLIRSSHNRRQDAAGPLQPLIAHLEKAGPTDAEPPSSPIGRSTDQPAEFLRALLAEDEGRHAAFVAAFTELARQQQGDLALQSVERALTRWPADDELKRRYVVAALLAGRDAEGLQALDELVETHAADASTLATGLLVLYESFQRGDPVQEVEQDRARMARLADAYRDLGGRR